MRKHRPRTGKNDHATKGITISWARSYDVLVNVMLLGREKAFREMIVGMSNATEGSTVLDVGCGTGTQAMAAREKVGTKGEVRGIDAAPEMIDRARQKASQMGADVDFQVGLIEDIPFDGDRFDTVMSSLMFHHLPYDLKRKGFLEMHRVLKPGGQFLIVDFKPLTGRIARLLGSLSPGNLGTSTGELMDMAKEAGFVDIESGATKFRPISFLQGRKGNQ